MNKSNRTSGKRRAIDWLAFGQRIRELRGFKMTQMEFATRIGVSQGFLSSIERGEKEVGAAILLRISEEFGRSIEWLLTGEDISFTQKRSYLRQNQ